jgi:hypothetical protein
MRGAFLTEHPVQLPRTALAGPLCLYGDAVQGGPLPAGFAPVLACHAAAARRGVSQSAQADVEWTSLPQMLLALAQANDVAQLTIRVELSAGADNPLRLTEALDLLLAALALDWPAQLHLSGAALLALSNVCPTPAAKGYASLPMFGLTHAQIPFLSAGDLLPEALLLPFRTADLVPVAETPLTLLAAF